MYADDVQLYVSGKGADVAGVQNRLALDLSRVCQWANDNSLALNTKRLFYYQSTV
jgi:hypothetical protein